MRVEMVPRMGREKPKEIRKSRPRTPCDTYEKYGCSAARSSTRGYNNKRRVVGRRCSELYLHNPDASSIGSNDAGSTHAWAEVYVPGAGWITFDPTNRSVGSANVIPVAVARHIGQTMPVVGSFVGMTDAFSDMSVEVTVQG
jgi:hypothetical protein